MIKCISFFLLTLLIIFLFFFFTNISINKNLRDINRINTSVSQLIDVISIDRQMHLDKKKVSKVIDKYNVKLMDSTKDSIVNLICEMSYKYEYLTSEFICATITHESAFTWNPKIKSPVGAIGLMQIMPLTGSFLLDNNYPIKKVKKLLENPFINIKLGCKYLNSSISFYGKKGGLVRYNAGDKWANVFTRTGRIVPKETQIYVPAILKIESTYNRM